jgi:hypothetical protein
MAKLLPAERVAKRCPLSLRTTKALRSALEVSAGANGRSITQEVEFLLERAMRDGDMRAAIREELRAELRAELRSEIRLAMAEYTVEVGEEDGDEARH